MNQKEIISLLDEAIEVLDGRSRQRNLLKTVWRICFSPKSQRNLPGELRYGLPATVRLICAEVACFRSMPRELNLLTPGQTQLYGLFLRRLRQKLAMAELLLSDEDLRLGREGMAEFQISTG